MEGENIRSWIEVWSSAIASLFYCYFVSSKIPKGKYRFLSLLPVISLFTLLPLHHLTSAFLIGVVSFFLTWLANFKLLLFAFDLGPLSPDPPLSLPLFVAVACLPIRTKQNQIPLPPKSPKLPLNLGTEIVIFSLLIGYMQRYRDLIHPKILLALYCCLVFVMVDMLISLSNVAVRMLLGAGAELEPPSDEPYLSTSLQDFWGKRWNLMVTNCLRQTVYQPVRSASERALGREWAPPVGVLATFVVSGLMHELLFFYVTRVSPTWETTGFFVLHGMCVVVEFRVKRAVAGRFQLHWAVAVPLTVGFVVATSFWLFFPPLIRNGADVRVIEEFNCFADYMLGNFMSIVEKFQQRLHS